MSDSKNKAERDVVISGKDKGAQPELVDATKDRAIAETPAVAVESGEEKTSMKNTAAVAGEEKPRSVKVTAVASPLVQQVQVPEILPLLPVRGSVGFPGAVMPLAVGRPKSKKLLDDALTTDKIIGVITQRNEAHEDPNPQDLYQLRDGLAGVEDDSGTGGKREYFDAWAGAVSGFGDRGDGALFAGEGGGAFGCAAGDDAGL